MQADRVALVTGATSGIGRAAALALARDGWQVVASGRDEARGGDLAAELGKLQPGSRFVPCDLALPEAPRELLDNVEAGGRLDALVYSAGVHQLADVVSMSMADFDRILTINVRAAAELMQRAVPLMAHNGGGVVVSVASEAGVVAIPGQVAYNTSKAALIMLTKSIAVDHAADGIRAVSVCPGTTRTPLVDDAIASAPDPRAHERMLAASRPANRLGHVEEIAEVIAFAVRDDVAYMTGTELVIDGGYTAR
ncbi:MAG: SDR family NAD(P)-dependent oxidoreductase [Actinomycetota bacterium]